MIPYVLQQSTSSRCKNCNEYVELLIERETSPRISPPIFFICFDCKKVFQAGVGELELIKVEE